jgi:predicted dienelactone hydrolase
LDQGKLVVFKIGCMRGLNVDLARSAWRSSEPRPLQWTAWYPTENEQTLSADEEPNSLFVSGLVARDAPLSSAEPLWPVVLLSHGTGGAAQGLSWIGEALAANGFIALAVSHHGNTAMEPYLPEGFLCWWERALDLTALLTILRTEGPFAGRLDEAKCGVLGFSLGGYTALQMAGAVTSLSQFEEWSTSVGLDAVNPREFPDLQNEVARLKSDSPQFGNSIARHSAAYRDERIKAVVALAPAPPVRAFLSDSLGHIDVSTLIIVGQKDAEAPHDVCALWLKEQNPNFEVHLLGDKVGHGVFFPEATAFGKSVAPEICCDLDGVDRMEIHRQTAMEIVRHFREALGIA